MQERWSYAYVPYYLVIQILGIDSITSLFTVLLTQPVPPIVGAIGAVVALNLYQDWIGYACATVYEFFIAAITSTIPQALVVNCPIL